MPRSIFERPLLSAIVFVVQSRVALKNSVVWVTSQQFSSGVEGVTFEVENEPPYISEASRVGI